MPTHDGAGEPGPTPFEYQTLLGALAARAGDVRLGVGVTEFVRRHPIIVAQSFITLAHVARRAPIVGVGAGEWVNTRPFGLPFAAPVARLEEGLRILRDCLDGRSPLGGRGSCLRAGWGAVRSASARRSDARDLGGWSRTEDAEPRGTVR